MDKRCFPDEGYMLWFCGSAFFWHGCGRNGRRLNFSFPQASGEYETASNLPDLVEEL
jgi:hypothetical protein